jgi:hypothetical protein
MVVLRVILGVILGTIFGLCAIAFVESRLHPSPGSMPVEVVYALLGFLALAAYFFTRYLVFAYQRRRRSARGFLVELRQPRNGA